MKNRILKTLANALLIVALLVGGVWLNGRIQYYILESALEEAMSKYAPTCSFAPTGTSSLETVADHTTPRPVDENTDTKATLAWNIARLRNLTATENFLAEIRQGRDVVDEHWTGGSGYSIHIDLPYDVFQSGAENTINVLYPKRIDAGKTGEIVIELADANYEYTYVYRATITADEDLILVHGSSNAETASGGEFNHGDDWFAINFYTSATSRHYQTHDDTVGRHGAWGDIEANFYRV